MDSAPKCGKVRGSAGITQTSVGSAGSAENVDIPLNTHEVSQDTAAPRGGQAPARAKFWQSSGENQAKLGQRSF